MIWASSNEWDATKKKKKKSSLDEKENSICREWKCKWLFQGRLDGSFLEDKWKDGDGRGQFPLFVSSEEEHEFMRTFSLSCLFGLYSKSNLYGLMHVVEYFRTPITNMKRSKDMSIQIQLYIYHEKRTNGKIIGTSFYGLLWHMRGLILLQHL